MLPYNKETNLAQALKSAVNPIKSIFSVWADHQPQLELSNRLNQNDLEAISVSGLEGSSPAILVSALTNMHKRPILVVTQSSTEAVDFYEDIIAFTDSEKVGLFPSRQILPYDFRPPVGEIIGIRRLFT